MTSKQQAIWHEVQKYWRRSKRDTLARIAAVVGCSKATVSRFLRRLDLWRFINLATIRGNGGGTYIFTRKNPYDEKPQRWTESRRARLRALLANRVKREQLKDLYANEGMKYVLERFHNALGPKPKAPRVVVRVQLSGEQMKFRGVGM
jgi:transcriptional regulator with XRE-family HTH domain